MYLNNPTAYWNPTPLVNGFSFLYLTLSRPKSFKAPGHQFHPDLQWEFPDIPLQLNTHISVVSKIFFFSVLQVSLYFLLFFS